jgi:hypothetical protein
MLLVSRDLGGFAYKLSLDFISYISSNMQKQSQFYLDIFSGTNYFRYFVDLASAHFPNHERIIASSDPALHVEFAQEQDIKLSKVHNISHHFSHIFNAKNTIFYL